MSTSLVLSLVLSAAVPVKMIDPPAADRSSAPNLTTSKRGVVSSWLERVGEGEIPKHRMRVATYASGTWDGLATVVESETLIANWADVPSVTIGADGELLAHYAKKVPGDWYAYDVMLATSIDGRQWTQFGPVNTDRTPTEHGFVSVVPLKKTGFRLFWLDGRATVEKGPTALRSALFAGRTSGETAIDDRVCDCCATAAARTARGSIIAYRDRAEGEIRDISVIVEEDGRFLAPQPLHRDGWKIEGCPVNGPAIAASGEHVAVAWFTAATGPASKIAISRDGGRTFGPAITFARNDEGEHLGRLDLTLDERGGAIVSWLQGIDDKEARVTARRIRFTGEIGSAISLAKTSPARSSGVPRIAVHSGELFFAYTEVGTTTRVRVGRAPISILDGAPEPSGARRASVDLAAYRARGLDGRERSFADARGKKILINIWATWCEPCREEMADLAAIARELGPEQVTVVAISVDDDPLAEKVRAYVREAKLPFEVWLDPADRISRQLGATAVPATFIADRNLAIERVFMGRADAKALRKALGGGALSR